MMSITINSPELASNPRFGPDWTPIRIEFPMVKGGAFASVSSGAYLMDIYPICQEDFHFSQKITGKCSKWGRLFQRV
jgi:hypothetical protein